MRFLLRLAFWLGLVLVLLPSGGSTPTASSTTNSDVTSEIGPVNAISAARATVADMGHFCERQHEACIFGAQAALALGQRAQAGAKMLYEFLNDQFGPNAETATAVGALGGPTRTTSTDAAVPLPAARPSQNTLEPADLAPAWRGPQLRAARG